MACRQGRPRAAFILRSWNKLQALHPLIAWRKGGNAFDGIFSTRSKKMKLTHSAFFGALIASALMTSAFSVQAETMAPAPSAPAKTAPAAPALAAGQFKTEADAKGHCPGDTVVWVNLKSKKYHYAGSTSYGKTKRGAYMCEKEATGFKAVKGEKKS